MTHPAQSLKDVRLLVAIASYGEKNLGYLNELIATYRRLPCRTKLVLVTECRKQLAEDIEQVIGLPSENPHSLPFAHKPVLADGIDEYDLFVYTEDDIGVSEENYQAFLRISHTLPPDEVPGFVRYEQNARQQKFMPDAHWEYHWDPASVERRGSSTIAYFTNLHTGFYVLTGVQLRKAVNSGRYLCPPYQGPYGMLESAATDPFTRCGLKKVICISEMQSFFVHHMSNRYADRIGIPLECWNEQIKTLFQIRDGLHPASSLCRTDARVLPSRYSKSYYEEPNSEVLAMVPQGAKTLLSVGCGWGASELELSARGIKVTALPLDSVIGAVAARKGVQVRYGSLDESLGELQTGTFDCIFVSNLLHLLPDPGRTLHQLKPLLSRNGAFVISGPNLHSGPVWIKSALLRGEYAALNDPRQSGIVRIGMRWAKQFLKRQGLRPVSSKWFDWTSERAVPEWMQRVPNGLLSRHWVVTATQAEACK